MAWIREVGDVAGGGMWRVVGIGCMGVGKVRVSRMNSCSGERKVVSKVGRDGGGGCFEVEVGLEAETGMEGAPLVSWSLSSSLGGFRRPSQVLRSSCNLFFVLVLFCWYGIWEMKRGETSYRLICASRSWILAALEMFFGLGFLMSVTGAISSCQGVSESETSSSYI